MKAFKVVIVCVIVTLVMVVSWIIGSMIGNALTQSAPPPPPDAASAGLAFLGVCAFNAVLITLLVVATGGRRKVALILYVFGVQFLLPQMETFFFAEAIGIGYDQATAILISGAVVAVVTMMVAVWFYKKMTGTQPATPPVKILYNIKGMAVLALLVYPLLYLTFGYFIAWQNLSLRLYYTGSAEMTSYWHQLADSFSSGIYFFQVLRAAIWIGLTIPVTTMLSKNKVSQYFVVGILSALLPTSLLFIPNPFMPWDIAMTHFVETASSNFVWGLLIVWMIRKETAFEQTLN